MLLCDAREPTKWRSHRGAAIAQDPNGGFCGGPGQMTHLAPTYAAVNALVTIGGEEALRVVNREALHSFLLSMKDPSGGFTMHAGGEVDVRGSYCALAAAFLTGTLTPRLKQGCAEFIARCQTYEGGMGGEPGNEAHGGYTFCAYAALILLGETDKVDRRALMRWCAARQMSQEGGSRPARSAALRLRRQTAAAPRASSRARWLKRRVQKRFQGRANKLVDGCYSFWQGGLLPLLADTLPHTTVVPVAGLLSPDPEPRPVQALSCAPHWRARSSTAPVHGRAAPRSGALTRRGDSGAGCGGLRADGPRSAAAVRARRVSGPPPPLPTVAPTRVPTVHSLPPSFQQDPSGGLRDKPSRRRDHYHTCYCLSGPAPASRAPRLPRTGGARA